MLNSIDWTRPWFHSVLDAQQAIGNTPEWKSAGNCCLAEMKICNELGKPVRFVAQETLSEGTSYEAFIYQTGQVPTRDNLHDFFNALMWLSFPNIKRQLNALQALHIQRDGIGASRGGVRDAATVFDENAALFVVREGNTGAQIVEQLRFHEWHQLFIANRHQFHEHVDVWLFGHALMEKLVKPYKSITAHAWHVMVSDRYFTMSNVERRYWLDEHVASQLRQNGNGFTTDNFMPLPVLGIPGWWPSQDEQFYADEQVFRPKRRRG